MFEVAICDLKLSCPAREYIDTETIDTAEMIQKTSYRGRLFTPQLASQPYSNPLIIIATNRNYSKFESPTLTIPQPLSTSHIAICVVHPSLKLNF